MSPIFDISQRQAVGKQLSDLLAEYPVELSPCRHELKCLATAMREPSPAPGTSELDSWSHIDLVAVFCRPDSIARPEVSGQRFRTLVEVAPPVLVFLPLLITWVGISAATGAYNELIGDGNASDAVRGRAFLELWQTGFAGKLAPALTFGNLARYTVGSIVLLILISLADSWFRRRREEALARREALLMRQLVAVLRRTQRELSRWSLATPARFAMELSRAAEQLKQLMDRAAMVQQKAVQLAEKNTGAAQQLEASARELIATTTALGRTGDTVSGAAVQLRETTAALRDEMTVRSADTANVTTDLISTAISRMESSAQDTANLMREVAESFADTVATAAARAADDTGRYCSDAVAAVTARLASNLAQTTGGLASSSARISSALDAASGELAGFNRSAAALLAGLAPATATANNEGNLDV